MIHTWKKLTSENLGNSEEPSPGVEPGSRLKRRNRSSLRSRKFQSCLPWAEGAVEDRKLRIGRDGGGCRKSREP